MQPDPQPKDRAPAVAPPPIPVAGTASALQAPIRGEGADLASETLSPLASTRSQTLRRDQSTIREDLKDRVWAGVVLGGKGFGYAAAAIVGVVAVGQVAEVAAGINPFAYFHEHPVLSHISTVAHMAVMFLAASAGFGLWKFRQTKETIKNKTEALGDCMSAMDVALDLVRLRVEPLKDFATDIKQRGINESQHGQNAGTAQIVNCTRSASELLSAIEALCVDPGSAAGKKLCGISVQEKITRIIAARDDLEGVIGAASPAGAPVIVPAVHAEALTREAQQVDRLFRKWEQIHEELFSHLPKINFPQAHQQAKGIGTSLNALIQKPDREAWAAITNRAIQLETSSREIVLPDSTRALLNIAVEKLQRMPEDASERTISESASKMARYFVRIAQKVVDADPHTDKFDLLRFQLHSRIDAYSSRYPNLPVRATVAGLIGSVSYWLTCSESLNALLPTGPSIYDNGLVGAKLAKHVLPFVIQGGIAFAAGAVNNKFRPYLTWASLELSKPILTAMAPFAWAYHEGQLKLGSRVDKTEKIVVDRVYKNK